MRKGTRSYKTQKPQETRGCVISSNDGEKASLKLDGVKTGRLDRSDQAPLTRKRTVVVVGPRGSRAMKDFAHRRGCQVQGLKVAD